MAKADDKPLSRFQFSLGTVLVAVAGIALLCAYVRWQWSSYEAEQSRRREDAQRLFEQAHEQSRRDMQEQIPKLMPNLTKALGDDWWEKLPNPPQPPTAPSHADAP